MVVRSSAISRSDARGRESHDQVLLLFRAAGAGHHLFKQAPTFAKRGGGIAPKSGQHC
jgi:hypothetical protein